MKWWRRLFTGHAIIADAPETIRPPVPGTAVPPTAAASPRPARDPRPGSPGTGPFDRLPAHGGRVKSIIVWADGRVVITDHRTRATETHAGFCPDCVSGIDWNAALRRLTR